MVTGIPTAPCTNPYGDYLLSLSIQNKQDYARLHSYELHLMSQAVTSHIRAGPWQKIGFIQKVRTCGEMPSQRSDRMDNMHIPGHTLDSYLSASTASLSACADGGTLLCCVQAARFHRLSSMLWKPQLRLQGGRVSGRDHPLCHGSCRR